MGHCIRTSSDVRLRTGKYEDVIGLCDGVFDLMHYGHILHLRNCKKLCDFLVVAIADDKFAKLKGVDRPIVSEEKRLFSIEALRWVDFAFICDGSVEVVNEFYPDVYFKNFDYVVDPNLNSSILLVRMPVYGSTTRLIEEIRK